MLLWIGVASVCVVAGDSVVHLLLHCGEVSRLWSFAFRSVGVTWVLPKKVIDLLAGWRNWLEKHSSNILNLVLHCVVCVIWRERNNRIFEDLLFTGNKLLALFAGTLFMWIFTSIRCF